MSSKPSSPSDGDGSRRRAAIRTRLAQAGPFGFGASGIGNLYADMDYAAAAEVVAAAWGAGIRLFDTAPFYGFGLSERRLGLALKAYPRQDVILSTKVGRLLTPDATGGTGFGFINALPYRPTFDYTHDGVLRSFGASLQRLGVDRIDVLLMHDLGRTTHGAAHDRHWHDATAGGGFRAMERLRSEGLVDAIGLGVNEVAVCDAALTQADLDVFVIAGRYTLLDDSAAPFLDRCHRDGVPVIACGIFNSGILATGSTAGQTPFYDYAPAASPVMERVAAIEAVCRCHGVRLSAVAQQFSAAHPAVAAVVIGLRDVAQVAAAIADHATDIPPALWADLRTGQMLPHLSPSGVAA